MKGGRSREKQIKGRRLQPLKERKLYVSIRVM